MTTMWNLELLPIWTVPGAIVIVLYFFRIRDGSIPNLWRNMKNSNVHKTWAFFAIIGAAATLGAFIVLLRHNGDAHTYVGIAILFIGAILWPITIKNDPKNGLRGLEPLALAITAIGAVLWATSTQAKTWWMFAAISAFYIVCVDMCWYMRFSSSLPEPTKKFGAWSGFLAMLHWSFASFIIHQNTIQPSTFTPDIQLTYNRWLRDNSVDTCTDTACVVYTVRSNFGSINITLAVAVF